MNIFSWVFPAVVAVVAAVRLWLLDRQWRHVQAHRALVPAAFRDTISAESHARSADYACAQARVSMAETVVEALLLLALTLGGGLAGILAFWAGSGAPVVVWGVGAVLTVGLLVALAGLPFRIYRTFRVEAEFGFNRRSSGLFIGDLLQEGVLTLLLAGPLVAAFLVLMDRGGLLWWLYAWGLWTAFTLTLTWLYPKWIAPLFHEFTPLEEPRLRQRILGLLQRCGFSLKGVYVMDASRRTTHGNAYFTGMGRAKRVVFFDTLLDTLAPPEVEAVLAHELGHYRLAHIRSGFVLNVLATLGVMALLAWLRGEGWFYTGLGVARPSDPAFLTLLVLTGPWFAFFLQPLGAWWSRRRELEADAFAARYSDPDALAQALVALYRVNASTLTPDPLYARTFHSHPSPIERVQALKGE
ncbi:M48 family metallopeptidase [Thiohalorhabdus sp. Cl-TMA]|uniref:M48 family metallopeptidase n=1 Tax=Thiohalorhabdus methylotrophus TaxID=3242694 RepID=A0ABV4TTV6_9GAMM